VVPRINRIQYYIRYPKDQSPASTSTATPCPLQDAKTIRLLRDIHGLQLNLARANNGVSDHVVISKTLKKDIKVKDSHIAAFNYHVQALQAQ
jgi:hypothetical protein